MNIFILEREKINSQDEQFVINYYEDGEVVSSETFDNREDAEESLNTSKEEGNEVKNCADDEKEYEIVVKETFERVINITTRSLEDAIAKVTERYGNEDIVLNDTHHNSTDIFEL